MLNSIDLNDKTYEQLLREAIARIPLYSREWTNYNASDPGITLLENLTAFQLLQQENINTVPEEVRRKLLKLVGFTARENRAACILAQAPAEGAAALPAGHRLWSGEIPFETLQETELNPWGLSAVYTCRENVSRDVTYLMTPDDTTYAYPFGQKPLCGAQLVCILSGAPEMGDPVRLWLQVAEEYVRNPFDESRPLPGTERVRWQYYTKEGWQDARTEDETHGLLRAGVVTLYLENELPAEFTELPNHGCALRCILEDASYDRAPRLSYLAAHLFPLYQQDTRVQCSSFDGAQRIELRDRLSRLGNRFVFCREEENGPYRAYREAPQHECSGRYYRVEETPRSTVLVFDSGYGYCPCTGKDAVRVTSFDEEMLHHRALGLVYGYENQTIELDLVNNVLPESFLALMEIEEPNGESAYWFVAPDGTDPDELCYRVRSQEGALTVMHPGRGRGRLYLAHCVVTEGAAGNLRAGVSLEQRGGYDGTEVEARFLCPAPGRGGVTYESVEELRRRFSVQLRSAAVAVRTEDYELLVRKAPGLCIHKVKAVAYGTRNLVRVVVKPYTDAPFPKLSQEYLQELRAYLDERRMLTTRIELVQPGYVPVAVNASLTVRGDRTRAEELLRQRITALLDHVNGPQSFGEGVRFFEVYQALNALPFVETVDMLKLLPETREGVLVGSDVKVDEHCLCCPGSIYLTLQERDR